MNNRKLVNQTYKFLYHERSPMISISKVHQIYMRTVAEMHRLTYKCVVGGAAWCLRAVIPHYGSTLEQNYVMSGTITGTHWDSVC